MPIDAAVALCRVVDNGNDLGRWLRPERRLESGRGARTSLAWTRVCHAVNGIRFALSRPVRRHGRQCVGAARGLQPYPWIRAAISAVCRHVSPPSPTKATRSASETRNRIMRARRRRRCRLRRSRAGAAGLSPRPWGGVPVEFRGLGLGVTDPAGDRGDRDACLRTMGDEVTRRSWKLIGRRSAAARAG